MSIKSPITGSENVVLEKAIPASFIIDAYKKELNIDTARFFKDEKEAKLYRCLDTGYRFFYPENLAGDDAFYQDLEKNPWYYMGWKWEHQIVSDLLKKDEKVLEIGSAEGSFLQHLTKNGVHAEGLEINSKALEVCKSKGLLAYGDPIEKFAEKNKEKYDLVCSFQVVEHIANIKPFLEASLAALRPGGRMVISVPNNDGVVFAEEGGSLNMPPHHMGRWNPNSLISLQNHFGMKVEALHLEPLQSYHLGFATRIAGKIVHEKLQKKARFLSGLFRRIADMISYTSVSAVSPYIIGHSVLIIFTKNNDTK